MSTCCGRATARAVPDSIERQNICCKNWKHLPGSSHVQCAEAQFKTQWNDQDWKNGKDVKFIKDTVDLSHQLDSSNPSRVVLLTDDALVAEEALDMLEGTTHVQTSIAFFGRKVDDDPENEFFFFKGAVQTRIPGQLGSKVQVRKGWLHCHANGPQLEAEHVCKHRLTHSVRPQKDSSVVLRLSTDTRFVEHDWKKFKQQAPLAAGSGVNLNQPKPKQLVETLGIRSC